MESPFLFGRISSGSGFTNRSEDLKRLGNNIQHGVTTILISPRRWGKSSLVKQLSLSYKAPKKEVRFCFIDLFNIRTEEEFYQELAKAVLKATASRLEEWVSLTKTFLQQLSPQISLAAVPETEMDLSIKFQSIDQHYSDLLNLAEKIANEKKIRLVICIDEFQNLEHFAQPLAFQKRLRAHWQHHRSVSYILYGSKRHMLSELFERSSKPFYKFGDVIYLEKIARKHWVSFITQQFKNTGKLIDAELAGKIADTVENHPYHVQQLSHEVWLLTEQRATEEHVKKAIEQIILRNGIFFQREFEQLSNTQINFLKAMAQGVRKGFSSKEVIQTYGLGTSANVQRILSALENREIIDRMEGQIVLLDPIFQLWLQQLFGRKS